MAQMAVALGLFTALSAGALGVSLTLLQSDQFTSRLQLKGTFVAATAMLLACLVFSVVAVVTRVLDYRLTARTVRERQTGVPQSSERHLGLTSAQYGRLTWFCFWCALLLLFLSGTLLVAAISSVYVLPLICAE